MVFMIELKFCSLCYLCLSLVPIKAFFNIYNLFTSFEKLIFVANEKIRYEKYTLFVIVDDDVYIMLYCFYEW